MNTKKYNDLIEYIAGLKKVAIAYSGGVDSTFLVKAAKVALGDNVIAITINSPYIPDWEIVEAKEIAEEIGVTHVIIDMPMDDSIVNNPNDRCYLCKTLLFSKMVSYAKEHGFNTVMDGTNLDDTKDFRPGLRALKELNVVSPLLECKLTKDDIRKYSKDLGLPTHNKPAYACLMTRIPHNTNVTDEMLRRIEKAEVFIHSLGIKQLRVRTHGDIARIEVAKDSRDLLFDMNKMDAIVEALKEYGYKFVTMDMAGYKMGSFNKEKKK